MKKILRILNPLIAILNFISWQGHQEMMRPLSEDNYEPYDFSQDIKYF